MSTNAQWVDNIYWIYWIYWTKILSSFRGGNKHPKVPKKFDRVILLIRDPFDRLVSEWNRENSGSHTGTASLKSFSNKAKWEKYVKNTLNNWQEFYTFYFDNYQSESRPTVVELDRADSTRCRFFPKYVFWSDLLPTLN